MKRITKTKQIKKWWKIEDDENKNTKIDNFSKNILNIKWNKSV